MNIISSQIISLEFIEIDLKKEFDSISYQNNSEYVSLSTYNRFLIPQLKPGIDKALYSDVDVIFLDDVKKMYNEDLEGFALGAIPELYLEQSLNLSRKERLGLNDSHKYFSAGNLLLDCKKWREENILNNLLEIENKNRSNLTQADMDVLNIYFDNNNYKILDPKYCVLDTYYDFHNIKNPVIRHYHGGFKPWHFSPNSKIEASMPNHKDFWYYLEMTDFYNEVEERTKNIVEQTNKLREFKVSKLKKKIKYKF